VALKMPALMTRAALVVTPSTYPANVAVAVTVSDLFRSAACVSYVSAVAPEMGTPSRFHCYETDVSRGVHRPTETVSC
jgi:hypothetical protein